MNCFPSSNPFLWRKSKCVSIFCLIISQLQLLIYWALISCLHKHFKICHKKRLSKDHLERQDNLCFVLHSLVYLSSVLVSQLPFICLLSGMQQCRWQLLVFLYSVSCYPGEKWRLPINHRHRTRPILVWSIRLSLVGGLSRSEAKQLLMGSL